MKIHGPASPPCKPSLKVSVPKVGAGKRNVIHTPANVPPRKA